MSMRDRISTTIRGAAEARSAEDGTRTLGVVILLGRQPTDDATRDGPNRTEHPDVLPSNLWTGF